MIRVNHLTKKYGATVALDNVSFSVSKGQIAGFLGPNGAGKSTAMNIITGYLSSTSGTVSIDGCDILEQPTEAKKKLGYLPEVPPLYPDMTVNEYLGFIYELKGATQKKEAHFNEICELTGITAVRGRLIKNLSKGYRQRVGIAQTLVGNPPVLILDEPTVGLDPKQIIEVRNLIKKLGRKHTVILSSHILSEVQAVCDRIIVLNNGKLVADSTAESLSDKLTDGNSLILKAVGSAGEVQSILNSVKTVKRCSKISEQDGTVEFSVSVSSAGNARSDIFFAFAAKKLPLIEIRRRDYSLEDIFMSLVDNKDKK
ncbi:MAG: ATP-binding cassette domain-containing protein [Acutalibacteraceae bacterium]|nr:ATP-binding cassette domain-containing protein [Acutalibacteraceae bacterium]